MQVTWANVGEGDCIYIEFSTGKNMVVDIDTWQPLGSEGLEGGIDFLRKRLPKKNGKPHIDLLVCSHPHRDHASGIATAIREFSVGEVWESGHRLSGDAADEDWYKELIEALRSAKATAPKASEDAHEPFADGTLLWVLSPSRAVTAREGKKGKKDIHDEAMVLRVEDADGGVAILTSDSRVGAWRDKIVPTFGPDGHDLLNADLMDASHHGSYTFFKDDPGDDAYHEGLDAISPSIVVISVGPNSHGHPHADAVSEYKETAGEVRRTDEDGTIVATWTGQSWTISTESSQANAGLRAGRVSVGPGGRVVPVGPGRPPTKRHRNWGV